MKYNAFHKLYTSIYKTALLIACVLPLSAAAEQINTFDVSIDVLQDGTLSITEEIEYDLGTANRHGIFREIPTAHPQASEALFTERYIEITFSQVLRDDRSEPYTIEERFGNIHLRVGDPDIAISGTHTYTIEYEVRGGLSYDRENDLAEIYWNAIGPGWDVPIDRAVVELSSSDDLIEGSRACYTGTEGERTSCVISTTENGSIQYTASDLGSNEGLTIAHELKYDDVAYNTLERMRIEVVLSGLLILWVIVLMYFAVRFRTKYKDDKPEIAQYEPYRDLKPMLSGVLRDGTLHPQDITAGILNLADRGFIKIKTTKEKVFFFFSISDHEVELLRPIKEADGKFDRWLLGLIFSESDPVGTTLKLSYLRHNTVKQFENKKTLQKLKKDAMEDLVKDGFYEVQPTFYKYLEIALFAGAFILFPIGVFGYSSVILFISLFLFSGGLALFFIWPRRTQKGYEAVHHLRGFERFLSVTGEQRFAFHNAPEKDPKQFLKYLPFAIAFGVEDEWAEVFEDVTIPNPHWYEGDAGTLHAKDLTSGIHSFSDAFTSSTGTSSSSSASSGGGSAGGGAGGGGGGSW